MAKTNHAGLAKNLSSTITLNDGVKMPLFGLGTFRITNQAEGAALAAMKAALKHGYRMFDTATSYNNEAGVGQAIRESGLKREEVFVVTKVPFTCHGRENTIRMCKESLEKLGTSYIDLYLIHVPIRPGILETYDTMLELKKQGLIRSVGVSNFRADFLEELRKAGRPAPSVNQIELHGCCTRNSDPIVEYCNQHGIAVMGWAPMAKGMKFHEPVIQRLAEKYKKSPGQLMIRWSVQKGYITIPKSSREARVIENADVFDWSLSPEDEAELSHLPHWSSFGEKEIDILTNEWDADPGLSVEEQLKRLKRH